MPGTKEPEILEFKSEEDIYTCLKTLGFENFYPHTLDKIFEAFEKSDFYLENHPDADKRESESTSDSPLVTGRFMTVISLYVLSLNRGDLGISLTLTYYAHSILGNLE